MWYLKKKPALFKTYRPSVYYETSRNTKLDATKSNQIHNDSHRDNLLKRLSLSRYLRSSSWYAASFFSYSSSSYSMSIMVSRSFSTFVFNVAICEGSQNFKWTQFKRDFSPHTCDLYGSAAASCACFRRVWKVASRCTQYDSKSSVSSLRSCNSCRSNSWRRNWFSSSFSFSCSR